MNGKIKSIKERLPQTATLPDGMYHGVWGGYVIEVKYNTRTFELDTEEGVRGVGIKVVVNVENGVATFNEIKN